MIKLQGKDAEAAKQYISYIRKFDSIHPSDEIVLTYDDDMAIQGLWSDGKAATPGIRYYVPADLIIENKIPLPNIRVEVDERNISNGKVVKFEVLLVPEDARECIKSFYTNYDNEYLAPGGLLAGIIKCQFENKQELIGAFGVYPGEDRAVYSSIVFVDGEPYAMDASTDRFLPSYLSTWYGIQIALLHPVTRKCFRGVSIGEQPQKTKQEDIKHNKRKTEYVKKVYVKRGELHRRIANSRKKHTLSWYVIGHWRHYKNGATSFVRGYWKGPLRDVKQNLDGGRTRVISGEGHGREEIIFNV